MYESFFRLREKPFELTPNPRFLYPSASCRKAATYLDYGLKERAGFMVLTGEVGSGKTTLIRHIIKNLDGETTLATVFNTRIDAGQLIAMICDDFGLETGGKDKVRLLRELNDFLISEYQRKRRALLVIDEAQNFTPELLEEVRLLSNLETDDGKLLQILLVGQPELAKILSLNELRQLRQRISIVCQLYPLTRQEMEEYILHRLEVAGNRTALQFSSEALDAVYGYSGGIPRLVNVVCGFALLTAFTEDACTVSGEMAADVVSGLEPQRPARQQQPEVEGRMALLKALGIETGGAPAAAGRAGPTGAAKDGLNVTLKELSLRISAMEKEYDRFGSFDFGGLAKRVADLESANAALKKQLETDGARAQKPAPRDEAARPPVAMSAALPAGRRAPARARFFFFGKENAAERRLEER